MSVAELAPILRTPPEQRFLLRGVDWRAYEMVREAVGHRSVRITYDRGNPELMSPLPIHEIYKKWLGRLLDILAREFRLRIKACGSTTFSREDLDRGLEPDECFYLDSGARVRDWTAIDLRVDPPPDLAIEVDITHSSLNRMGIYAALRVPEVWRFDGTILRVYQLSAEQTYEQAEHSRFFPTLPLDEVVPFLNQGVRTDDDISLEDALRAWVRSHGPSGAGNGQGGTGQLT